MALFQAQSRSEKARKERKSKSLFRSVPTRRVIENFKKIAKKFKKLKNTIMGSFQAKIGWKMQRKQMSFRSVSFLLDAK